MGCKVVDADKIAHELLDKSNVREEIVGSFGKAILEPSGKIDHKKLADIVFCDGEKLSTLNKILHRLVLEQAEELIKQYNSQNQVKAIVLDMPLLVEVGWAKKCDNLIFVDCERQIRAARAKKVGFFDENQLKIRENFQISLDNKSSVADNSIDNNSDFSTLVRQVTEIFSDIVNNG